MLSGGGFWRGFLVGGSGGGGFLVGVPGGGFWWGVLAGRRLQSNQDSDILIALALSGSQLELWSKQLPIPSTVECNTVPYDSSADQDHNKPYSYVDIKPQQYTGIYAYAHDVHCT